jgi:hypothetical protein
MSFRDQCPPNCPNEEVRVQHSALDRSDTRIKSETRPREGA